MPKVVVGGKVHPDIYAAKTGPRGPKGDIGDTGATGPKGEDGADGAGIQGFTDQFASGNLSSVRANTDVVLNDNTLYYRQDNDKNHSLAWGYSRHGVDGPVLNGFNGVGFATGDANDSEDVLVAEFDSSGLRIPPLSAPSLTPKVLTVDYTGRVSSIDQPAPIPFTFPYPLDTWVLNHNLGVKPDVNVYSDGGREMWAEVLHVSNNQAVVYFDVPTTGTATANK